MKLTVTLTGTDNPYLAPRLPLVGTLDVLETTTDGHIIHATFFEHRTDDSLHTAVQVKRPTFTYTPR